MDKQAQDKLWNDLSEESKEIVINNYRNTYSSNVYAMELYVFLLLLITISLLSEESKEIVINNYRNTYSSNVYAMEQLFGSHNLNPKPQIKTWEDVEKSEYLSNKFDLEQLNLEDTDFYRGANSLMIDDDEIKLKNKLLATYKIAKLIDLGYGGMVTEEENKNPTIIKYGIFCYSELRDKSFNIEELYRTQDRVLCFHTKQQVEEFMSYESNRKLVEQYYMM